MKYALILLIVFFPEVSRAERCVNDLREKHRDDGVEEIKKFVDLNGDNVLETIVLLKGSMTSRYGVVYLETKAGCYKKLYSGSENVGIGAVPEPFHGTNRIEKDEFNGFKLLSDSSWGGNEVTLMLYAYDKEQSQYKMIYSATEYGWFY